MRRLTAALVVAATALTGCASPTSGEDLDPSSATTIASDRQIGPVPASEIITRVTDALDRAGTFTAVSHTEFTASDGTHVTDTTSTYDFRDTDERRLHLVSTTGDQAMEIITIGTTTWMRTGENSWSQNLNPVGDQTALFPDGVEGAYVAREKISGVKLHHYRYRSSQATIDLYLDDDDRPIVTITTINDQPLTVRYSGFGEAVDIRAPDPSLVTESGS